MKVFEKYAQFYDDLYLDKDYEKECQYLIKLFDKYSLRKVKSILDLGCGTGSHDLILAKKGHQITGIDFSSTMLKIARQKAKKMGLKIDFHHGDIRRKRLKTRFDSVISMFAVMGYQIRNEDVEKALETARAHLKKNGLFVFEIWFGPAVLTDKPKSRTKKVKLEDGYLIRKTSCDFHFWKQYVEIHFQTKKYSSSGKLLESNRETHPMRFFFPQELNYFLEKSGFQLIKILPFLSFREKITDKDWNICVIAKRK